MIAVSEPPLEYIPRGRRVADEHPGPEIKQHPHLPSENLLLLRLQNVNISAKEEHNEFWCVREIYEDCGENRKFNKPQRGKTGTANRKGGGLEGNSSKNSNADPNTTCGGERTSKQQYGPPEYMCEYVVNSEEELYVKKHTAVWTRGNNVKCMLIVIRLIKFHPVAGICDERSVLPHLCFTCETPIKFAFFCNKSFVSSSKEYTKDEEEDQNITSICLIGKYKI